MWNIFRPISGQPEIHLQERLDDHPKFGSFSWQVLSSAAHIYAAKTFAGLTNPLFSFNARTWKKSQMGGTGPKSHLMIVKLNGLDQLEQAEIIPTPESTDNRWVVLTHPLGWSRQSIPQS